MRLMGPMGRNAHLAGRRTADGPVGRLRKRAAAGRQKKEVKKALPASPEGDAEASSAKKRVYPGCCSIPGTILE